MARSKARSKPRSKRGHLQSFKELVGIWADLFREHNLLTYASAVAFQMLVAVVAILLLIIGILREVGRQDIWTDHIAPAIEPKVLLPVFAAMNATVQKIFDSSSVGLIIFAAALSIWEISGVVRACMGALAQIYEYEEKAAVVGSLPDLDRHRPRLHRGDRGRAPTRDGGAQQPCTAAWARRPQSFAGSSRSGW
jgi:uncharacterized BrkB/YihY/UPF0761 family membrane protein